MENRENHLLDILILIDKLQKRSSRQDDDLSCTRPFLGANISIIYNTRPVVFYLCNNQELSVEYVDEGVTLSSSTFRVEKITDKCVTVRLLSIAEDGTISPTNQYATVNIDCIAAIRCLADIYLTL